jgi:hypothetical protein
MGDKSLRRSFVLPRLLVEDALSIAPEELRNNMNRLVISALQEYVKRRKEEAFEKAMATMAHDPALRKESEAIRDAFLCTEADGLSE